MLKDKYDGASKVRVTRRGKLRVRNRSYRQPTADDLVYIRESPDYCRKNTTLGSSGIGSSDLRGSGRPSAGRQTPVADSDTCSCALGDQL